MANSNGSNQGSNAQKNNLLTNKALAYLNAKKSNLRIYEEQINP